jgi:thymidylate kinase
VSNKDTSPEESAKWVACLPLPRKTFLYRIEPEVVIKERPESAHDHSMDIEWQRLKHDRYLILAQQQPERIVTIDATEDRYVIAQKVTRVILDDLLNK